MTYPAPSLVDVSGWQKPPLPWARAREAGILGVYVKATEGATHTSPAWRRHAEEAGAEGLSVGFYHFARPNDPAIEDAKREADAFIDRMLLFGLDRIQLIPALDLETRDEWVDDHELACWVDAFQEEVCGALGIKRALLYGNRNYLRKVSKGAAKDPFLAVRLSRHLIWIAHPDTSALPSNSLWARAVLWQSEQRRVDWYDHNIDCDVLCAPLDAIELSSHWVQPKEDAIAIAKRLRNDADELIEILAGDREATE